MKLVDLQQYRNREIVAVLRDLLELAEGGHISGLAFVTRFGPGDHRAGLAGEYRKSPEQALTATFQMERNLRQDIPGNG